MPKFGYLSFVVECVDNAVVLQGLFECCGVLEGRGIFGGAAVFF